MTSHVSKIIFERTGKTTAYVRLPNHPGSLKGGRTVSLRDLVGAYKGPYIVLDFTADNTIVGIEIIDESQDDDL